MSTKIEEIAKQFLSRAGVVRVNSILNSTLWASVLIPPICWIAAWIFHDTNLFEFLIYLGCAPIILLILQSVFFSLTDPSRLQSEEYQIQEKQLNILERKGAIINTNDEKVIELDRLDDEENEGDNHV